MSKVSLPFWKKGEAFEPVIYPEDLADYEDREDEAVKKDKAAKSTSRHVLKEQVAFIRKVLEQSFPGEKADLKLTVAQVRLGFVELWTKGQDWREDARPLADAGGSSPPLLSQASG